MTELIKHKCVNKDVFNVLGLVVEQHFDDFGNHRVVVQGDTSVLEIKDGKAVQMLESPWIGYQWFTFVDVPEHDLRVFSCTENWSRLFPRIFWCEDARVQFEDFGKQQEITNVKG